jgi:hypothetical protein
VSVIVTTKNSADTVRSCLESIRAQVYRDLETIVVDNGSTDSTIEIANELADQVLQQGPERSAQRNRGVAEAHGVYVLIVDSDMVLAPDVVESCVEAAADGAVAITIPEVSRGEGLWAQAKALERSCYVGDDTIEAARFFRRETFLAYGGYDEQMTGPEDWDLPARMRPTERFGRASGWITHLEGRPTLLGLARKKFYYGKGFGRYLARNRGLAARQLQIVRPAYLRHWRRLASSPVLSSAMLAMKVVEFSAGGFGLAVSLVQARARKSEQ